MRGRKPQPFQLKPQDAVELHRLIRDGHTSQRVARRARVLLARADQYRVQDIGAKLELVLRFIRNPTIISLGQSLTYSQGVDRHETVQVCDPAG